MADCYAEPVAAAALEALAGDPTRTTLAARVDHVVDLLETDPGAAEVRRHRFQTGQWAVSVDGDGEEWAILWTEHPTSAGDVLIVYAGPASFA